MIEPKCKYKDDECNGQICDKCISDFEKLSEDAKNVERARVVLWAIYAGSADGWHTDTMNELFLSLVIIRNNNK